MASQERVEAITAGSRVMVPNGRGFGTVVVIEPSLFFVGEQAALVMVDGFTVPHSYLVRELAAASPQTPITIAEFRLHAKGGR